MARRFCILLTMPRVLPCTSISAILAVVFTMLMIVAAEYFGLAKEIFDAFKETYDIAFRDALASVPDFLTEAEIRS